MAGQGWVPWSTGSPLVMGEQHEGSSGCERSQPLECLKLVRARASYLVWEVFLLPRVLGESEWRERGQSYPPSKHPQAGDTGARAEPLPKQGTSTGHPAPLPSPAWQGVPALTCSQTSNSSTCEQGHSVSTALGALSCSQGSLGR